MNSYDFSFTIFKVTLSLYSFTRGKCIYVSLLWPEKNVRCKCHHHFHFINSLSLSFCRFDVLKMKLSSLIFFFIFLDTGQGGRVLETSDQCRNIIEGCSCPLKTQPHYLRCKGLQSDLPVILDSLEGYDIRLLDLSLRKLTNLRKNVLNTTKLSALVISSSQLTTIL